MGQKKKSWTVEELQAAVKTSRAFREVARKLGLQMGSTGYITNEIRRLKLDTSHFAAQPRTKKYLCSDDELRRLVEKCRGTTDVLRSLGLSTTRTPISR